MRRVLVAGGTGFVGRNVMAALTSGGWTPISGARHGADRPLDLDRPETLRPALAGCDAAVFLIHRMTGATDLHAAETAGAEAFLRAAEAEGVRRIVYLGGPTPAGTPSAHLASRIATGRVLRSGAVPTIELRAGMIVGVGSESWMICRDLALRLPVMILPTWLRSRSQPVWIGDVVTAVLGALGPAGGAALEAANGSVVWELPGPEVLTARAILERIAAQRGMRPLMVPVPVLTPRLSSMWLRGVTRADYRIARQLVEGLTDDLVTEDRSAWEQLEHTCLPFDEAVARTLAEEEPQRRRARIWETVARRVARPL